MNKEHHIEVIKEITKTNIDELKDFVKHLIETDLIKEAYLVIKTMNNLNLINMMINDFLDPDFMKN